MENGRIYELIGKAMGKIGAIGKDNFNSQQKYKFRGIDDVYNALNPVLTEFGLFICPEVLEQKREERVTTSGGMLKYTILTMRYTVYAPDGSNISMTVVGEGMDSGDKSANKAMSVAMKYAMFQLFCIPTEEMVDPDKESFEVAPNGAKPVPQAPIPVAPAQTPIAPRNDKPVQPVPAAVVTTADAVPQAETAESYRRRIWPLYAKDFSDPQCIKLQQYHAALVSSGMIQNVGIKEMDLTQIKKFFDLVYRVYGSDRKAG